MQQKTRKLNLGEKFWLRANRKPSGKTTVYISQAVPWILIGLLLVMDMLTITATIAGGLIIWFPIVFTAYTIGITTIVIHIDRKRGYVDALHEHYLKRREARMTELLGSNPESKS